MRILLQLFLKRQERPHLLVMQAAAELGGARACQHRSGHPQDPRTWTALSLEMTILAILEFP